MQYSRLDYKKTPAKLVVPATFYIFERICQLWPESSRVGMSAICDCENLGWAQFDLEVEKLFSDLMSDRLPIRIGHVRVVFVFFSFVHSFIVIFWNITCLCFIFLYLQNFPTWINVFCGYIFQNYSRYGSVCYGTKRASTWCVDALGELCALLSIFSLYSNSSDIVSNLLIIFFYMLSLAWQATSGRAVDSSQALDLGIVTHVIDSSVANNPRVRDERGKVAARIVSILNADTGRSKLVRKPTVVLSLQS